MATFIIRQPIEGDTIITAENVGNGCWVDGDNDYIPGSLALVINGTQYPISSLNSYLSGYLEVDLPINIRLKAGDSIQLTSTCSSDNSITVSTLAINLLINASDATSCNNTSPITAIYNDWIRLFFAEYDGEVMKLKVDGTYLGIASFFKQNGSLGDVTSPSNEWTPDPDETTILFSNNNYNPPTVVDVEILDDESYFTVRLGYIEIIFDTGSMSIIDYIEGSETGAIGGGYTVGDVIKMTSNPGSYTVQKNGASPFFTTDKSINYILPSGAGSISPNPTVAGLTSVWTLPTIPGPYYLQAQLGEQVIAPYVMTVLPCKLTADDKTKSVYKGTFNNQIPALTGSFPANCDLIGYVIKSLPLCGVLKLGSTPVVVGQPISIANAASLLLDVPGDCIGSILNFTYAAVSSLNGCQESNSGTVTISMVSPTATANNDLFSIPQGVPSVHNVSINDSPCSAGSTFYEIVPGSEQNGSVTDINPVTGVVTFSPNPNFTGLAYYNYNIKCGLSLTDSTVISTASVTITVVPSCDTCEELKKIQAMLKQLLCNDIIMAKNF